MDSDLDFSWLDLDPFADDGGDLETARQLERPLTHARREAKREFISGLKREALNELIPVLPPPDVDLYVIGNGAGAEIRHGVNPLAFDFGSFIPHVVRMLGDSGCTAYVSTWTMARGHALTMLQMLDDGRLSDLTVFTDPYFKRREAAIAAELITGLLDRGQRFLAFKNHCKILALSNPQGRCCTIMGSANLSAQPRTENYTLTTASDVYAWVVRDFFLAILNNAN